MAAYLAHGLSNKEIGEKLFICEKTVKFHSTFIYKKLKVKSKTKLAVAYANRTLDHYQFDLIKPHMDKLNPPKVVEAAPYKLVHGSK